MRRENPARETAPEGRLEEKPFLEHLEDLRRTLIRVLLTFGCAFLFCLPLTIKGWTVALLKRPLVIALSRMLEGDSAALLLPTLAPAGGVAVAIKISFEAALVVSFPILLYLVGNFVFPALTRRERRYFTPALAGGAILFYTGMALCYFVTLPWALQFFWNFNELMGIHNLWTINEYVRFASRLLLAFGLVFELPLVILSLVKIGILDYKILREKRRYAIIIAFVAAAILTPPDAVTQIMMALPLLLLYEICVWGARFMRDSDASAPDYVPHRGTSSGK